MNLIYNIKKRKFKESNMYKYSIEIILLYTSK